ncbi:PPOX class F420-dependent oxidoreductase [Rathayibacter sp. YIM 133350]|uniref:PPOX class F420-dependent oxidoreductase n=1 Tax=Rathayibacter sp. YIM 133350 TaxID=3131992 RepID=UPI00307E690C
MTPTFTELADSRFVELSTYRKDGTRVATPVWVVREGDDLLVTTDPGTGKVKRVRNNGRAALRPCNRFGKVNEAVQPVPMAATVRAAPGSHEDAVPLFRRKYGLEFPVVLFMENLFNRKPEKRERVILRLRPQDAAAFGGE